PPPALPGRIRTGQAQPPALPSTDYPSDQGRSFLVGNPRPLANADGCLCPAAGGVFALSLIRRICFTFATEAALSGHRFRMRSRIEPTMTAGLAFGCSLCARGKRQLLFHSSTLPFRCQTEGASQ